jgi:hypothetical protein
LYPRGAITGTVRSVHFFAPQVARMKRIGLEPGKSLDFKALPASIRQALQDGATDGLKAVHKRANNLGPVKDKESNWLPAPNSEFDLIMRAYSPRPEILSGEWAPPPVTKVK